MSEAVAAIRTAGEFYDGIAGQYEALFLDDYSLDENQTVFDLIGKDMWEGESILNLGCGPGTLLGYVGVPPSKYLGVDVSPKMVALAQARYLGYRFRATDIADARALAATIARLRIRGIGFAVSTFGVLSYVEWVTSSFRFGAACVHAVFMSQSENYMKCCCARESKIIEII